MLNLIQKNVNETIFHLSVSNNHLSLFDVQFKCFLLEGKELHRKVRIFRRLRHWGTPWARKSSQGHTKHISTRNNLTVWKLLYMISTTKIQYSNS